MIKMAQLEHIKKMYYLEELSIREISKITGHHRDTIAKYLNSDDPEPPRYRLNKEKEHPVLGPYIPIIEEIMESDLNKRRKQRHTGMRIFERLRDEYGYTGGYSTITDYLRKTRPKKREAFLPLEFELGAHAEVDWAEAHFFLNGKETTAYLFIMKLGASWGYYVQAYPFEKQEAFFDGHRRCFEFMGGVPYEIAYDNLKTAVRKVLKGSQREEQDQFIALRTHYLYQANFCRPRKGNEKGGVENAVNNVSREILSNGIEVHYSYDLNNRLTVLDHVYGENSFASFSYFLDNMSNPLSITNQDGDTTEYSYDDIYQLIEADYPDHDTVNYTYDAVGNRISANDIVYTYNNANQLINADGTSYSYDDNGCLTSAGNKNYSYDSENRLVEIDDGTNLINFFYDGDGNRIGETVAGEVYKTTEFVYDVNYPLPRLLTGTDDQGSEYNYIYGNRLLERSGIDGFIFYHQDGLGSTSVVSSVYGEALWEYDYDAFGNLWDTSVNDYNPMQFTGEYYDETGDLLYLRARYYDPTIGRFITPDSYTGELTDPLSQNLYVYCGNNPVANTDPSGHMKICQLNDYWEGTKASYMQAWNDILATPDNVKQLYAMWQAGEISYQDLVYMLEMTGKDTVDPYIQKISSYWYITFGDPTDEEVYQYAYNSGEISQDAITLIPVAGAAGAASKTVKTTSKASKAASKVPTIDPNKLNHICKRQTHSDVSYIKSGSSTPRRSQRALLTIILKSSSDMLLA